MVMMMEVVWVKSGGEVAYRRRRTDELTESSLRVKGPFAVSLVGLVSSANRPISQEDAKKAIGGSGTS
jgi:hypothetical protein